MQVGSFRLCLIRIQFLSKVAFLLIFLIHFSENYTFHSIACIGILVMWNWNRIGRTGYRLAFSLGFLKKAQAQYFAQTHQKYFYVCRIGIAFVLLCFLGLLVISYRFFPCLSFGCALSGILGASFSFVSSRPTASRSWRHSAWSLQIHAYSLKWHDLAWLSRKGQHLWW